MKTFIVTLFSLIIPCLSYSGINPYQYLPVVLDLSHFNTVTSYAEIKQSGIKGIIHKITQGVNCPDGTYESKKGPALKEGLLWGAYHFGTGLNGVDQANYFLKTVGNDTNILLALDVEFNPQKYCGGQITLEIAEDFVTTVYKARNRYPLIYGGSDFLLKIVKGKDTILRKCPLWLAGYTLSPPNLGVGTWPTFDLWQYTDGNLPRPYFQRGIENLKCLKDTINNLEYGSAEVFWQKVGYK